MKTSAMLLAGLLGFAVPVAAEQFDGATSWLNSSPLTTAELRGKVVLVNFWTYTCINWMHTLPYVRAWAEKYRDQGLVVVGVHTPEFEFEKNLDNVQRAVKAFRVAYPVAVDSNYSVWRAFSNSAWPAVYLLDAQGRVRFSRFGEGEYDRTEKMIQQLLAEAGNSGVARDLVSVEGHGVEAAPDWADVRTPETYLGAARGENYGNLAASNLRLNQWTVSGDWARRAEAIALQKADGHIALRFHSRDVHLVMGAGNRGSAVRFRVLIDGKPPAAAHGGDVDEMGYGTVTEQRLYQLVRQPKPIVDRTFDIEFLDPGIEAFSFTFG